MRIVLAALISFAATVGAAHAADQSAKPAPAPMQKYKSAAASPAETAPIRTLNAATLLANDRFEPQAEAEPDFSGVEAQGDAAYEDEIMAGGWSFTGTAGMVSDYRYRGVSLTNNQAALQADFTFASTDGLYFYGWASQIADNGGDDIELQGMVGWSGAFFTDAITMDASAGLYVYPGLSSDASILELSASFTQEIAGISITSGISYMPEQTSLADIDDTYLSLSFGSPLPFWDASGSIGFGWEDGAFADRKVDWIAAFDVPVDKFTLRLAYAGAERHFVGSAGDGTLFAELRYNLGDGE